MIKNALSDAMLEERANEIRAFAAKGRPLGQLARVYRMKLSEIFAIVKGTPT